MYATQKTAVGSKIGNHPTFVFWYRQNPLSTSCKFAQPALHRIGIGVILPALNETTSVVVRIGPKTRQTKIWRMKKKTGCCRVYGG